MFKLRRAASGSASLTQQIFLLEQRVLGRRHLLHHQIAALRQGLHQKVARSINVFLVSSVAVVLGYFAARRLLATSTKASTSTTAATSTKTASSSSAVRPAGIFVTFIVAVLRLFARSMFFLAGVLRFFVIIMDAIGIVKLMVPASSQSLSNSAPVAPAESALASREKITLVIKRKPGLLLAVFVACVSCTLIIFGWLYSAGLI